MNYTEAVKEATFLANADGKPQTITAPFDQSDDYSADVFEVGIQLDDEVTVETIFPSSDDLIDF